MFTLYTTNLMNTQIAEFYKTMEAEELKNIAVYFQTNGGFNASKIVEYLCPNLKSDQVFEDLANYKYENYLQYCKKLLPIFQYTKKILKDIYKNAPNGLKLQWLGDNVCVYLNMKDNYENVKTETFEHTLILTSILSNALTNVYLRQTKAKQIPHLLRDLINSDEIIDVFGIEMVILLKILLGLPNSINLRNIVWHGFPKPGQIPSYYVNVLLITIHSLGCVIEKENINPNNRNQITSYHDHIEILEPEFRPCPINLSYIKDKLRELKTDFNVYWVQLVNYYENQNFKEFVILALPQIELLLRLHYGTINNYDITAKLDEYYITIETIFNPYLPNVGEETDTLNKLLDFQISNLEGCFQLLFDLFLSPNGCRLRDKVSHGEVYLEALNNSQLCSLVFQIFLVLIFPKEIKILDNYESKLHLNSITKLNLIKSSMQIKNFYSSHLKNEQNLSLNSLRIDQKILIFKRPKKEAEFMLLINKIAENVSKTVVNYEETLKTRFLLLAQRELHSRRRKTLEKLQMALPNIFQTLSSIISCGFNIFKMLQNNLEDNSACSKTLRFLKRCLTISENFLKYSHFESNEWIKAMELCHKYDAFYRKFYVCDNCQDQ